MVLGLMNTAITMKEPSNTRIVPGIPTLATSTSEI